MYRVNDIVGPYKLLAFLGEGSFGEVWKAIETDGYSREVAIKFAKGSYIHQAEFEQEAKTWGQASGHPNILPLIRAKEYDDPQATAGNRFNEKIFVIVSEFAQDGSLQDWLKQQGGKAPTIERAVAMMRGILAGLEYLHTPLRNAEGEETKPRIIHRDLKPDNIMMQHGIPRISDFGLSRVINTTSRKTQGAGSPAYMAPEAYKGIRTERTDIWSAGVIFYELVSGEWPFRAADQLAMMYAIVNESPYPLPARVPQSIQNIIFKCLAKNPEERFDSVTEMMRALDKWQEAPPCAG